MACEVRLAPLSDRLGRLAIDKIIAALGGADGTIKLSPWVEGGVRCADVWAGCAYCLRWAVTVTANG